MTEVLDSVRSEAGRSDSVQPSALLDFPRKPHPPVPNVEDVNLDMLEDALVEAFPGLDLEELITHRFADGVYAREMLIPAGVMVVSMTHKTECVSTCSKGAIWVWTAGTGEGFRLIEAPFTAVTPPGTRRVGIAEVDTIWSTYHATRLTDVEEIESEIFDERSLDRREVLRRRSEELRDQREIVSRAVHAMAEGEMTKCLVQSPQR